MTTGTLSRTDTGSFAAVRPHRPAVAPVSSGNPLTGWMPPSSWADEPTPLYDGIYPDQDHRDYTTADGIIRAAAKTEHDQAALLAAWVDEHASWAAAEMRQIVEPLAAEQAAQHAATTYAQLPPNPAEQLQPEVLDAEHQAEYKQAMAEHDETQRQLAEMTQHVRESGERLAAVSPQLADKWRPAPDDTPPEPRRLLRDELAEFWNDVKRLPSELRAWRPWRKGAK